MKRAIWKCVLPALQLTLALACHVYDVHEYRERARRDGPVGDFEYTMEHRPAISGRTSQGLNFPALVLAYPFSEVNSPVIYERNSEYTYFSFAPREISFFLSVVLFWCWVGGRLDALQGRGSKRQWSRKARVVALLCGVVFGILNGMYADELIGNPRLPHRQIGVFGLAWTSVLVVYFTWRLVREFNPTQNARRSLVAIAVPVLVVAVLWIGGPLGVTQALGEYLRPTTVKVMPVVSPNISNEAPPANLMRTIEAQQKLHHLSLQRIVVYRSLVKPCVGDQSAVVVESDSTRWWLPQQSGCCTYQYRRHFAVVVGQPAEMGVLVVEAALVQSRWGYLRDNWNKLRRAWGWPYPPRADPRQ